MIDKENEENDKMSVYVKYASESVYKIRCSKVSENGKYLALGLEEGSLLVWSIKSESEQYCLDKHKETVTVVCFLKEDYVISGGMDGTVHIYSLQREDLLDEAKVLMKRRNTFQGHKNTILNIKVSDMGLAMAIDS